MPQSYQEHNGDNSTHTFTIAFGSGTTKYLKREHIKLYYGRDRVAGTQTNTLTLNTDYVYISDLVIKLIGSALNTGVTVGDPYPLASGKKLTIERETPQDTLLVPWADGSNLTKEALETSNLQVLFGQQEIADTGLLNSATAVASETASNTATTNVATLTANYFNKDGSVAMTGNLQLGTNKITGVGDPTSAQDAVTKAYLERTGSIASAQIVDGTIVDGDVNASAAISGSKLQAASGSNAGSMSSANFTKLAGIDTGAKDDQTGAEIKVAYEAESNTNAYTDAEKTKLAGCDVGAKDDQTAAEIKSLYESNSNTNAFTDANKTLVDAISATSTEINYTTNVTSDIQSQINNKQPLDSELTTLAGMQAATASKLAAGTNLTSDIADLNQIDGLTKQTTISDSDASFPTSGAVVDYVAAQISPLGGLEVVATEVAFPNTQPASGVVISISDAGGVVINGSGVSTTGRTVGGATITINGFPSSLHSETLVAGVGLMVSSTGSSQTYNYHKILGKEDDIKQLSDDINDFNARYRVGSSNPSGALDAGDLFFNTSTSKLLVYNATNTAWEEAQSIGNFYISTLSPAFNGSLQDFTITNAPTNAEQILLSINGVIQKPNAGTSTPSEGFALSGSTVKLGAAPASTDTYFAVVIGSTVNIGTPSNNTVSEAILQNNQVSEEKLKVSNSPTNGYFLSAQSGNTGGLTWAAVNTDLVADTSPQLGGNLDLNSNTINGTGNIGISGVISGQSLTTDNGGLILNAAIPTISFVDSDQNPDYLIKVQGGVFDIRDNTADVSRLSVSASGAAITGELAVTGDVHFNSATNAGKDVYWDESASELQFSDSTYATFGTGEDLKLYHNGTNDFIQSNGGYLKIQTDSLKIHDRSDDHPMITAVNDGAVELYYDNSKKFETTSDGVNVTGHLDLNSDTGRLKLGAGDDLSLYHDGSNSYIVNSGGSLRIWSKVGEYAIEATPDGSVDLYHNNAKKFETNAYGVKVNGHIYADDSHKLQLGTSQDLEIYHSGSHAWIKNSTGYTHISAAYVELKNAADNETMLKATQNGAVELYYDNSKKFETISDGVKFSGGRLYAEDNQKIVLGAGNDLQIYHDGSVNIIDSASANLEIKHGAEKLAAFAQDGQAELYYDNSKKFETGPGGTKFFNESIWGNAGSTDPWTATGDVAQGVLLYSEDVNVKFPITANSNDTITQILNRTNGNGAILEFKYNGSVVGSISSNGSSLPSDRDFKTNISDLNLGLSLVNKLKPSQFNYKIDDANTPVMYGLIAQELEETLTSEGVTKNSTQLIQHHPTDDTESNYDVDYLKLVPILINSIKELSEEVKTLKTKVAALESA